MDIIILFLCNRIDIPLLTIYLLDRIIRIAIKSETLTMLNPDIFCFDNSVDPDQLASEKPADQDQHCLSLSLQIHAYNLHPMKSFEQRRCKMGMRVVHKSPEW